MGFQVSPGVEVIEKDITGIVPVFSTTAGGLAGPFRWGPLNEIVLVEDAKQLETEFGKPNDTTAVHFYTAFNFLQYGNKLRLVRVANESDAKNATAEATTGSQTAGTGLLIKNETHYIDSYLGGAADVGPFAAKWAGAYGNSLRVSLCPSTDAFSQTLTVSTTGTAMTGTSFTTKLEAGSIIYDAVSGEERVVASVTDATNAVLESAFTVDLTSDAVTAYWQYHDEFGVAPGTSDFATARSATGDEMHIIVVDEDGVFSGVPGTILERFAFLSKASDAKKTDGTSAYYRDVINNESKYLWWTDRIPAGTNWGTAAAGLTFTSVVKPESYSLAGGTDGTAIAQGDSIRGYDLFLDENVDVFYLLGANATAALGSYLVSSIAEVRKDCIVFLSPELADVVNNAGDEVEDSIAYRDGLPSSSFFFLDSGWKYQYDRYNDVYRWIPLNGDVAGCNVRADTASDPWVSPAGLTKGQIKNVVKLAYSPSKSQRDDLYLKAINPVIATSGQGVYLFGDKTGLSKPSAFDRINVRKLFIVLEKAIARASQYVLFEFNDEFTRAYFRNIVEPFLRDVKSRRGIDDFRVVCDETNNTGEVVSRNELVGDIYIRPNYSINFIRLNFIAVRDGIEFSEIVGF